MDKYIESKIEEYGQRVYGGNMPVENKATLRDILRKEDAYWARYEGREEEGHSNSAVGDRNNMEPRDY